MYINKNQEPIISYCQQQLCFYLTQIQRGEYDTKKYNMIKKEKQQANTIPINFTKYKLKIWESAEESTWWLLGYVVQIIIIWAYVDV